MSFITTLQNMNNGKLLDELDESLAEVVSACYSAGKKGTLTLKLSLKPGKGGARVMAIDHDIKVGAPEFDRPQDHFYVLNGNQLTPDNPEQRKLNLTTVERPSGELVEKVDHITGEITTVQRQQGEVREVARA